MWFVPPPRFRFLIQAPRPHQWQCILTCNAESPEDFEYCLPTKGCYSVNRILSSLTLVWLDSTGVKSCSPTAWVFCSCKGLSSDKASTLLYRVWLSLVVYPSESESLLRLAMHNEYESSLIGNSFLQLMHLSFTSQEVWGIRDLGDRFLWIGLRQIFDWPPRLHLNSLVDQEHLRGVKSRQFWKTGLRLHHVTVESPSRPLLHFSNLKSVRDVQKFRHHLTGV